MSPSLLENWLDLLNIEEHCLLHLKVTKKYFNAAINEQKTCFYYRDIIHGWLSYGHMKLNYRYNRKENFTSSRNLHFQPGLLFQRSWHTRAHVSLIILFAVTIWFFSQNIHYLQTWPFHSVVNCHLLYRVALITRGFFTTKDEIILHTVTIDNDFFWTVLEGNEIITLEIIVPG